jgi:NADH-quinone oxidoreductase subunit L
VWAILAFALGIFAIFYLTGSINFDVIFAGPLRCRNHADLLVARLGAAEVIAMLLFIGAMGGNLRNCSCTHVATGAMGPTPVS